ncbi:MAG TPA: DUF2279 domain-containing protein [Kofleriaceae bacterium]|nr:DUF2279 domain-containing protein [Kofleriaceae bacterium]
MGIGRPGSRALLSIAAGALILGASHPARAQPPPGLWARPARTAAAPAAQPSPAAPAPAAPASVVTPITRDAPDRLPATGEDDGDDGWTRGKLLSLGGLAGLYTGVGIWAYFAWYNGKPRNPGWEWNGDGAFGVNTYAGGSDKLGHFYSTHVISRATTELLRAGGWRRMPASLIASGLCAAYFTMIEVKDAYYYEFSTGDLIADLAGAGLGVLMVNSPAVDRLLDVRVDYWPTSEYIDGFKDGDVNFVEDYSGQTYLLALHVAGVPGLTDSRWTRWGRYLDLVGGFQSLNYKPEPADPEAMESQHLFLGVAINMQAVLDDLYGEPAQGGRTSHRVMNSIFEYVSVPYTTLRVAEADRSKAEM